MTGVTVSAGGRLHVGFGNLSLGHERLYGGIGLALAEPRVTVRAEPADGVRCADDLAAGYAERAVELLGVSGVSVSVEESLPRHVGLGSGTQLALAVLAATARAHGLDPGVRDRAPGLGRGGRSGVGVATFESGGIVVDAGHPTGRFTTEPPETGSWSVPPVVARHEPPPEWRVVIVLPETEPGRCGEDEDAGMRAVVERADPAIADEIAGILTRRLLPATADGRLDAFGDAVSAIGRKNGAWYAEVQGGVYRPPAGSIVDALSASPVLTGVGQSSWGPAVYGLTDASHASEARSAALDALSEAGVRGSVILTRIDADGARVES